MQATGLLNYRLKHCWPKIIYCICQPNELEREITKKTGGAKQKSGGAWPTQAPLRIATASNNLLTVIYSSSISH